MMNFKEKMNKQEMVDIITKQIDVGIEKIEAIRKLAIILNEEEPIGFEEQWFQQKISGS